MDSARVSVFAQIRFRHVDGYQHRAVHERFLANQSGDTRSLFVFGPWHGTRDLAIVDRTNFRSTFDSGGEFGLFRALQRARPLEIDSGGYRLSSMDVELEVLNDGTRRARGRLRGFRPIDRGRRQTFAVEGEWRMNTITAEEDLQQMLNHYSIDPCRIIPPPPRCRHRRLEPY